MRVLFFSFLLLSVFLIGCTSQENRREWKKEEGKLKVLCTTAMIEDLVKQVGGEYVQTLTLITGELDPHSYQLVKGDDEKLAYADLVFSNGLGLEHGPSLRDYLAKSEKNVSFGDLIRKDEPDSILTYKGSLDPHIWMDISFWIKSIVFVVAALKEHDPARGKAYEDNGEMVRIRLQKLHDELRKEMQKVPDEKRYLITSHDAFNYFARAYLATDEERKNGGWQKRFAAPEGLAPESQLSTTDIRLILDHMKTYQVHVIFPESNVSQASIRKLLDAGNEKGMALIIAKDPLYGDAMGPKGSSGDSYEKMIEHNVKTLSAYLQGH
jgi:manganese/zinc/iron transport system substrate-binding protein